VKPADISGIKKKDRSTTQNNQNSYTQHKEGSQYIRKSINNISVTEAE
jgi:hypothetical protein